MNDLELTFKDYQILQEEIGKIHQTYKKDLKNLLSKTKISFSYLLQLEISIILADITILALSFSESSDESLEESVNFIMEIINQHLSKEGLLFRALNNGVKHDNNTTTH